jgi:eukaryotic-like serine/threonine-protein kinase
MEAGRSIKKSTGSRFGRYLVGPALGSGAAATVFLARLDGPHGFERLLALKVIHEHLMAQQEFVNLFLDEANLAVRLSHPNIVHMYELGLEQDRLYLALEYLHGQTLSSVIKRARERGVRVPCEVVAWIGARAADALHYAHELVDESGKSLGIVHRDVSPQNMFITYDGHVKLIDFGIARAAGRLATTGHGKIRGKFRYMAPEQATAEDFDHRVDLFALGATLYEVAVGSPVFEGTNETDVLQSVVELQVPDPVQKVAGFPPLLAQIMLKSLSGDPSKRQPSGAVLANELDSFVEGCGPCDPRARLSEIMDELFHAERVAQSQVIDGLRGGATDNDVSAAPTAERLHDDVDTLLLGPSLRPHFRGWQRAVALGLLGLVLAAGGMWLVRRAGSKSPSTVPQPASSVVLDVRCQPPVDATVRVGGQRIEQRPARTSLLRSATPVDVEVTAVGFDDAHLAVVPDRDQFIVVPLMRSPLPDSPEGAATLGGSSPSQGEPPPSAARPRPSLDPGHVDPRSPTPSGVRPTGSSPQDGIVKEYPFGHDGQH